LQYENLRIEEEEREDEEFEDDEEADFDEGIDDPIPLEEEVNIPLIANNDEVCVDAS
jgi:hypothetical protein